jgi:hypothetical protein
MEQAAESSPVRDIQQQPVGDTNIVPSHADVTAANTNSRDAAQRTVDNNFGTPVFDGLTGHNQNGSKTPSDMQGHNTTDAKTGDAESDSPDGGGGAGGKSEFPPQNKVDALPGGPGGESIHDNMKSPTEEPQNRESDREPVGTLEKPTSNANEVDVRDQLNQSNQASAEMSREILTPDQLVEAGQRGDLAETLKNQGVDIDNPEDVKEYLSASYDEHIAKGLRLAGQQIPENYTDADLGKALAPSILGSQNQLPEELKQQFKTDPAEAYRGIRQVYLDIQNGLLAQEKARPR